MSKARITMEFEEGIVFTMYATEAQLKNGALDESGEVTEFILSAKGDVYKDRAVVVRIKRDSDPVALGNAICEALKDFNLNGE